MPRPRRAPKRRFAGEELTREWVDLLGFGSWNEVLHGSRPTDDEQRKMWEQHRDAVIDMCGKALNRAAYRPRAFYRFDLGIPKPHADPRDPMQTGEITFLAENGLLEEWEEEAILTDTLRNHPYAWAHDQEVAARIIERRRTTG